MKPATDESATPGDGIIEANIEFTRLDVAQLANHVLVQFDGEFFFLHFCQVQPPLLDSDELNAKKAFTLKASPVASVALPLAKMGAFLGLLNSQYDKILKLIAQQSAPDQPSEPHGDSQ